MTRPLDNLADRVLAHEPITPGHCAPETIVLPKGSLATAARRAYVDGLAAAFPLAEVIGESDKSHHKGPVSRGRQLHEKVHH